MVDSSRLHPWRARLAGVAAPCAAIALLVSGCSESPTNPSPVVGTITLGQVSPASGSIVVSQGTPPGAFIPRGSGAFSVSLSMRPNRSAPWAQLYVYLLSGDSYCAQNLPDTPSYPGVTGGQLINETVTGFQVFRLPCEVTGIRAMLHIRNNGLLTPPTATETLAEGSQSIALRLDR